MEVDIVISIQQGASAIWDVFFQTVTLFGDKMFFVVAFCLFYWCYDKRFAFNFAVGCGASALVGAVLKVSFNRPRPYMVDSRVFDYSHLTDGSFPSGHSMAVSTMSTMSLRELYSQGQFATRLKKIISTALAVVVCCLVALSRLYLGQHFLSDVIFGLGFGFFVGYIWHEFCFINNNKEHIYALFVLPALVGAMFIWGGELFSYGSSHTEIYFLIGIAMTIIVGYYVEKRFIRFEHAIQPTWFVWFKIVFGLGSSIGLYFLLGLLPDILILHWVSGLLLGVWVSLILMIIFKLMAKYLKII